MADIEKPIDEARTTRPRAGMVFKDRRELPGVALLVAAVLAVVGCLAAAAMSDAGWALGLGLVALVAGVGGVAWILTGRRRTREGGSHRAQP